MDVMLLRNHGSEMKMVNLSLVASVKDDLFLSVTQAYSDTRKLL